MTRRANVVPENDPNLFQLVNAVTKTVAIFGKSWSFQVESVLRTTLDENREMIYDSVKFLRSHGREVIYDAEHFFDGLKADPDYAFSTLKAAKEAGACMLVLCDTRGGSYPTEIYEATRRVLRQVGGPVGIHSHNDRGVATANSLFAVMAGASHVQGTINGLGERVGNANLIEVVANLRLMDIHTKLDASRLSSLSRFVYEISGLREDPYQPFVGRHAFSHKGGVHGDAVLKTTSAYEFFDPAAFGNRRHITVSSQAGRSSLFAAARKLGLNISRDDKRISTLLHEVKRLESLGCNLENADATLELLVQRTLGQDSEPFRLTQWEVTALNNGGEASARCNLTMDVNHGHIRSTAVGNGPVHALDQALRSVLKKKFGKNFSARLTGYRVREIDSEAATAAMVAVYIDFTNKHKTWTTVASSTNILQASVNALVDGYAYSLMQNLRFS